MRRKVSTDEIRSYKKRILDHLLRQPAQPKDLYAIMDPDIAYQALLALTTEGKVKNEGLTYYHTNNLPKQVDSNNNTTDTPTYHGKPAEHRLRAKKYTGELTDPNSK